MLQTAGARHRARGASVRWAALKSVAGGSPQGMALVFAGEGDLGARSIPLAVAQLEASDELRYTRTSSSWWAPARSGSAARSRSGGGASTSARSSLSGVGRALGRMPELLRSPRGTRLGDDERVGVGAGRLPARRASRLAREKPGQQVCTCVGDQRAGWLRGATGTRCRTASRTRPRSANTVHPPRRSPPNDLCTPRHWASLDLCARSPDSAVLHYEELAHCSVTWDRDTDPLPVPSSQRRICALVVSPTLTAAGAASARGERSHQRTNRGARARRAYARLARVGWKLRMRSTEALALHEHTLTHTKAAGLALPTGARSIAANGPAIPCARGTACGRS